MRAVVESLGSELAQTAPTQSGVVLTELTRHIAPLLGDSPTSASNISRVIRPLFAFESPRFIPFRGTQGANAARGPRVPARPLSLQKLGFRGPATPGWGV